MLRRNLLSLRGQTHKKTDILTITKGFFAGLNGEKTQANLKISEFYSN